VSDTFAGPVLAIDLGGGAGGFLVVVLLGAAAVGLFVAMAGSLRRMRANVARGEFGVRPRPPAPPADRKTDPSPPSHDPTIPPQR
jgi:hypothetical protein